MGETLDDGTDLNKYSKALESAGVNIKDENNELKDMDVIIEEIGAKWQTMNRDSQIALAQTVAGVRQYNQFVALFDNFDIYKENQTRAANAEGSLEKQADIYAESWKAAQKRVEASAQGIYDSLINDEFFIQLNDFLADTLGGIEQVVDALGGLSGVLSAIGMVVTSLF